MRFDGNTNNHLYTSPEGYPVDKVIGEWRETAQLFEEAGFTTIWLAEHHFWYDGNPGRVFPPTQCSLAPTWLPTLRSLGWVRMRAFCRTGIPSGSPRTWPC